MKKIIPHREKNAYSLDRSWTILALPILLLFFQSSLAQHKTAFDSIFYHAAINLASKDINRAKEVADSLYHNSAGATEKMRTLMLLADLQENTGEIGTAISYALEAEKIASENSLYEWQARINGFLSTQYRNIGLMKQGKKFLMQGLEASKKISNRQAAALLKGLAFQEAAYYDMGDKEYEKTITNLKKAAPYFEQLEDSRAKFYNIALNEEMLGKNYLLLDRNDNALSHYEKALRFLALATDEETILAGFIYGGLGRISFEKQDHETAHGYYCSALQIAESSGHMNLKADAYRDLAAYYGETGDLANYKRYGSLYEEELKKIIARGKVAADGIVNEFQKKQERLALMRYWLISGLAVAVGMLLASVILGRRKRRKDYRRFEKTLKDTEERYGSAASFPEKELQQDAGRASACPKELMSKESEMLILKKLAQFERSTRFLDKNIRLSVLSARLKVNSKYLSHIINKYKGKDFNNYISELRIYYMINKMESNPSYLNYKIEYLADESGFSSHSKFTVAFKTVTGLAPSTFIALSNSKRSKGITEVSEIVH